MGVILIKLADRLHNIHTLCYLAPEKRERIARETLEIYAPIAHRLGMHIFRLEFEENGFSMLYPMRYRILQEAVKQARGNRKEIISTIESSLVESLERIDLDCLKLEGREKHLYSIYNKMRNKHLKFSEIMDVYAFRIVVRDVNDCYRVLGIMHNLYNPLPERFKDYIAIPKINGYQSLHTVLFGPYGVPIEIQIRTENMHKMAENGIAAHWLYKTEDHVANQAQLRAREWIKGLLEIQKSTGDSLEFIENVKIDLFPDEVYVFTPNGEIMELPNGATPIDFAYAVHSDIGNSCVAAKINKQLVPLSTKLRNGETVEIIVAKGLQPNPSWLDFIVTGKARSGILHYLKHQRRADSVVLGKRLLEQALQTQNASLKKIAKGNIKKVLAASNFSKLKDLFESIGLGNQMPQIVARRLVGQSSFQITDVGDKKEVEPLHIKGSEGLIITFSKCCRPIPGDPIEGILTAGHGIVVHHSQCNNLIELRRQLDRCIPLRWEEIVSGDFEVELHISVINKRGIFAGVALAIADAEANINHINLIDDKKGHCSVLKIIVAVKDKTHLSKVMQKLSQLKDVTNIERFQSI